VTRFADPTKFARLSVGPCECPGKPHTDDWMDLRTELGAADMNVLASGTSIDALELLLVRWNFLEADGSEAPIDRRHLEHLFSDLFPTFNTWLAKNVRYATLPNRSAAPSQSSTRRSGSPTPRPTKAA
jgi:hypothetical protein